MGKAPLQSTLAPRHKHIPVPDTSTTACPFLTLSSPPPLAQTQSGHAAPPLFSAGLLGAKGRGLMAWGRLCHHSRSATLPRGCSGRGQISAAEGRGREPPPSGGGCFQSSDLNSFQLALDTYPQLQASQRPGQHPGGTQRGLQRHGVCLRWHETSRCSLSSSKGTGRQ